MAIRGAPLYLNGNDDEVLLYLDKLDTVSPPQRTPATGLTGLTVLLSATETGAAINAALSKSLTEIGSTGYYTAVFEGSDVDAQLDNATYRGKDVYQIAGNGSDINIVTVRRVLLTRRA